jgi:hypothetical protein
MPATVGGRYKGGGKSAGPRNRCPSKGKDKGESKNKKKEPVWRLALPAKAKKKIWRFIPLTARKWGGGGGPSKRKSGAKTRDAGLKPGATTDRRSGFDEAFEAREGVVPLATDDVEIVLGFAERFGVEFEEAFAAGAEIADDSGAFEDAKMFGDGLARETRAARELGNGSWAALRQPGDE